VVARNDLLYFLKMNGGLNSATLELRILSILIAFFLFWPLIRPLVNRFQGFGALVWLPPLALAIAIGIFPAYGFRLECVPLLIYTLVFNILNIPALLTVPFSQAKAAGFYEWKVLRCILQAVLLFALLGIALWFSPVEDTALIEAGVSTTALHDTARDATLYARVYGPESAASGGSLRPLIILAPPLSGSVTLVDRVCAALRDSGFTVLTWSHAGGDLPAVDEQGRLRLPPLGRMVALVRTMIGGRKTAKANAEGRALEADRLNDITFLLAQIRVNTAFGAEALASVDTRRVFLAGYGAGGSAVITLASSSGFVQGNPEVQGVIAVEAPLYAAYRAEAAAVYPVDETNQATRIWSAVRNWFARQRAPRIAGLGTVPRGLLPTLFLVSDAAFTASGRAGAYLAVTSAFAQAEGPAILAAVEGSGPLDYSDCPRRYPLLSFFAPGVGKAAPSETVPGMAAGTAAIIADFAALGLGARTPSRAPFGQAVLTELSGW
jgi:dienelactone hydrolase